MLYIFSRFCAFSSPPCYPSLTNTLTLCFNYEIAISCIYHAKVSHLEKKKKCPDCLPYIETREITSKTKKTISYFREMFTKDFLFL